MTDASAFHSGAPSIEQRQQAPMQALALPGVERFAVLVGDVEDVLGALADGSDLRRL